MAFVSQIEPKTVQKALNDSNWISAMQEELNSAKFKAWALRNGAKFKAWALRNDAKFKAWALSKVPSLKLGLW